MSILNIYIYLGKLVTFNQNNELELEKRINITWKKFWSLKEIFKSDMTIDHTYEDQSHEHQPSPIVDIRLSNMERRLAGFLGTFGLVTYTDNFNVV